MWSTLSVKCRLSRTVYERFCYNDPSEILNVPVSLVTCGGGECAPVLVLENGCVYRTSQRNKAGDVNLEIWFCAVAPQDVAFCKHFGGRVSRDSRILLDLEQYEKKAWEERPSVAKLHLTLLDKNGAGNSLSSHTFAEDMFLRSSIILSERTCATFRTKVHRNDPKVTKLLSTKEDKTKWMVQLTADDKKNESEPFQFYCWLLHNEKTVFVGNHLSHNCTTVESLLHRVIDDYFAHCHEIAFLLNSANAERSQH